MSNSKTNISVLHRSSNCSVLSRFHIKDFWSTITHFIGFIASIFMMPVMLVHASSHHADSITLICLSIFMVSMILLYGASSAYHAFDLGQKRNKILKKIDHLMIFVLIAGSYTPICMCVLPATSGIPLLIAVWGIAVIGMVIKLFWIFCPKWFSSLLYIAMGWSCIVCIPALYQILPRPAFLLLLSGGLFYTVGGVLYALKLKALNERFQEFGSHEIFHVFVMIGNLCHFLMMFLYI